MGCGAVTCKKEEKKKENSIQYDFETTHVGEIDNLFDNAGKVLEVCEKAREGFRDNVEDFIELSGCDELQTPNFIEALKVFLWSVSANNEGQIIKAGLKVTGSAPYLYVDCGNCYWDTWYMNRNLTDFLTAATDLPNAVKEALESVFNIISNITSFDPASAIDNSGLNPLDKARAAARFASNVKKLSANVPKLKMMPDVMKEALEIFKEIIPKLKEITEKTDEVGVQAYKADLYNPRDIFRKYHKGQRKTPADWKKIEDERIANLCHCPKCEKEEEKRKKKGGFGGI